MRKNINALTLAIAIAVCSVPAVSAPKKTAPESPGRREITALGPAVLWRNPTDIASRDLFYGPGGEKHQPIGPYTFLKEDPEGTNPKFDVRDGNGVKWKIKLGEEARPETVATRLVWAAGYTVDEVYFLPNVRVANMPAEVHRGGKLIGPGGVMTNVRVERESKGEKKIDNWQWMENPFLDRRELNGLKVMMALINNWDLKDINNAI